MIVNPMLNSLRIKYVHSSFNFLHSRIYNTFLLLRKGKGSMVERLLSLHPRPLPPQTTQPQPKGSETTGMIELQYKADTFLQE